MVFRYGRVCAGAALQIVLAAALLSPVKADITVNYVGPAFDPSNCQQTRTQTCLTGPITESFTIPGIPHDYTGSYDEERTIVVNSVRVESSGHMLATPDICYTYASLNIVNGNVTGGNVYITEGDNARDCSGRQLQINIGGINQAAIYYNDFKDREWGEIIGGQGQWSSQPYTCGDERDQLIQEYVKYKAFFYDENKNKVPFRPDCGDFTRTAHSDVFSFKQLNTGKYRWALIRAPLVAPAGSAGLDEWVKQIGRDVTLRSVYRNPQQNYDYYKSHGMAGKATFGSRHLFGDAADIANQTRTLQEHNYLVKKALAAGANWTEKVSGPCGLSCVHADWRDTAGAYQN